jgi:gag-polypeptide of LTR copia-type
MTNESKLAKRENNNAINSILNSVSESAVILFGNIITANEMWNSLLTRYEGNSQIKRIKLIGLEIKFENFRIENDETL